MWLLIFPDIRIALQVTAANVQRDIRTVNHTVQEHQEFRNDILDLIGYKYLVGIQLDLVFLYLVALLDLWEIQNTGQVERIIYVQVDPE